MPTVPVPIREGKRQFWSPGQNRWVDLTGPEEVGGVYRDCPVDFDAWEAPFFPMLLPMRRLRPAAEDGTPGYSFVPIEHPRQDEAGNLVEADDPPTR